MRAQASLILALLALGACAQLGRPPQPASQAAPAAAPASASGEIARAESQISLAGDDSIVLRRQVRRLPDRYAEVLTLDDGMIEYQKFASPRAGDAADGRGVILRLLATETYRQLGLPEQPSGFRVARNRQGEFDYALVEGPEMRCVLMSQFFGATPGGKNQELRVTQCRETDAPRAEALEGDVLQLIGRINLDGGAMNRSRTAAIEPRKN